VSGWSMTLRNAHERYVQVGDPFSGLFLSIKSTDPAVRPLVTVRVPSGAVPPQQPAAATAGRTQQRHQPRRWEDSVYLAERLAAAERQLKV